MINDEMVLLLTSRGYRSRKDSVDSIVKVLSELGADVDSELAAFISNYDPSLLRSEQTSEQLQDALPVLEDASVEHEILPWETPIGMTTQFVREVWELPQDCICLTSTEGEGAFVYRSTTQAVYDFTLGDSSSIDRPRWETFNQFIEWYLG